jgi:hypothetical protein
VPAPTDVLLAIAAVLVGCFAGAAAFGAGWRSGNWLAYVCGLGCAAFVAGVVGQRVFPSAQAVAQLGQLAAGSSRPGPWDAGVSLPVIGVRITPVALVGLLVAAVGLSLLLLFEHVPDPGRVRGVAHLPLEDEDTV